MWIYPVSVNKTVHEYISPKLCLTPKIQSKYSRIGECVGIGQTTVVQSILSRLSERPYIKPYVEREREREPMLSRMSEREREREEGGEQEYKISKNHCKPSCSLLFFYSSFYSERRSSCTESYLVPPARTREL